MYISFELRAEPQTKSGPAKSVEVREGGGGEFGDQPPPPGCNNVRALAPGQAADDAKTRYTLARPMPSFAAISLGPRPSMSLSRRTSAESIDGLRPL
jgi:hypothetical protein